MLKRMLSFILMIVMILTVCLPAQAKTVKKSAKSGRYYRIKYAANNRYLDVPSENYIDNGTQLQIWDYAYGHQNQIFQLEDTGNGWHIKTMNGKIVEVRDSSHEDFASVAQWDYHNLNCGLWKIKKNSDGTVSFKNKESGKYLNVEGGGDAKNGTKMIQYPNDKTIAMKFYLELLRDEDVLSAFYEHKIDKSQIQWTAYNPLIDNIKNDSHFSYEKDGVYYYPTVGQRFFVSMEFLSPNSVSNLLKKKSYDKSTWKQITEAVEGEFTSEVATAVANRIAKDIGIERNIPFIGCALSILKIAYESQDQKQWNRFVDTVYIDANGRSSGIVVYTYCVVTKTHLPGPNYNVLGDPSTDWWDYIRVIPEIEYGSWTGDNFGDVSGVPVEGSGKWVYAYK